MPFDDSVEFFSRESQRAEVQGYTTQEKWGDLGRALNDVLRDIPDAGLGTVEGNIELLERQNTILRGIFHKIQNEEKKEVDLDLRMAHNNTPEMLRDRLWRAILEIREAAVRDKAAREAHRRIHRPESDVDLINMGHRIMNSTHFGVRENELAQECDAVVSLFDLIEKGE